MSFALAMTHDATVGNWQGVAQISDVQMGTGEPGDLSYLMGGSRSYVLDAALGQLCRVTGSDGTASVFVADQKIMQLNRPAPGFFRDQLRWLRDYSDLRGDRIGEIVLQTTDIVSFFGSAGMLNGSRRGHTLELINTVLRLTSKLEHMVKHLCRAPRPIDLSDHVHPIIQTPDHSAFPSGHATESFAVATVLNALMRKKGPGWSGLDLPPQTGNGTAGGIIDLGGYPMPYRIASRIAINRTIAGVHFPVDNLAGALLGCAIGQALLAVAHGKSLKAGIPPTQLMGAHEDFTLDGLDRHLGTLGTGQMVDLPEDYAAPTFQRLWANAAAEWPTQTGAMG